MKDEFKMKLKKIGIIALIVSILSLMLAAGEISHPQTNQNDQLGTG